MQAMAQKQKAVIVNGNKGVISSVESVRTIRLLERNGYNVIFLTGLDATWPKMVEKAQGAKIIVYSGKGIISDTFDSWEIYFNSMTSWDPEPIRDQRFVNEIHLAPGAMIYFKGVNGGAGNANDAEGDFGLATAHARVTCYSSPFFNLGASVYFASDWSRDMEDVFKKLLNGISIEEVYLQNIHYREWDKYLFDHGDNPTKPLWIAARYFPKIDSHYPISREANNKFPGFNRYYMAFSGDPQFSLQP